MNAMNNRGLYELFCNLGGIPGVAEPFILTDFQIFFNSKTLQTKFETYKDKSDILGPNPIIEHYKLKKDDAKIFTVGDIWDNRKIHPKVAEMIKEFARYFSYTFSYGLIPIEQLMHIIEDVPENKAQWYGWRKKCWDQMLQQKPTLRQFVFFFECNFVTTKNRKLTDEWKDRFAEKILSYTEDEVKVYSNFFFTSKWRDPNAKTPSVDFWGLCLIERVYGHLHAYRTKSASIRKSYSNAITLAKKKLTGK